MNLASGGAQQGGNVVQALCILELRVVPTKRQLPRRAFVAEHVARRCGLKSVALAPTDRRPGRCAKPFVLRNGIAKMESRRVSAAQCGGQQSQVMVDAAVIRGTAPNNRV